MAGEVARRRLVADILKQAHANYRAGDATLDGHYRPAVRTHDGVRYSGRINRHGRFELAVNRIDGKVLERSTLAEISLAHAEVQGSALVIAYSDPRDTPFTAGKPLGWAVLHVKAEDSQPGLLAGV